MMMFTRECPSCGPNAVAEKKRRLLEHYATKEPVKFLQLDGFTDVVEDCVMHPDDDGDTIFSSWTWELKSGGIPVRVHILEGTSLATACRVLAKLLRSLSRTGPNDLDADGRLVELPRDFADIDSLITF